jgi:hypothetical protein
MEQRTRTTSLRDCIPRKTSEVPMRKVTADRVWWARMSQTQQRSVTGSKPKRNVHDCSVIALAHNVHDGSSRNHEVAKRDGRVEPREREASLKQDVDRPSGEPVRWHAMKPAGQFVAAANP